MYLVFAALTIAGLQVSVNKVIFMQILHSCWKSNKCFRSVNTHWEHFTFSYLLCPKQTLVHVNVLILLIEQIKERSFVSIF